MNSRQIDILLAAYNGSRYIAEQIDSILAQTADNWRLLICDDMSTDDTARIVADYAKRYSDKIEVIDNGGRHLGACMNFGRLLEHSTADYIAFSDQDDIWLPEKIAKTFAVMQSAEKESLMSPILVHTDLQVIDEYRNLLAPSMWAYQKNNPQNGSDSQKVLFQNVATGCTIMINKFAKAVSLPLPPEAVMHDWWIAVQTAKHGKIFYLPQQLVLYRQHDRNAVGAKKGGIFSLKKRFMAHFEMAKKYDSKIKLWPFLGKRVGYKISQKIF